MNFVFDQKEISLELKITSSEQANYLKNLSTENLLIWVIGKSVEKKAKFSVEDIVLECWLINPEKHSLRGHSYFPDSFVIIKRIWDMKGRKGLVEGTSQSGFKLTVISQKKYKEIETKLAEGKIAERKVSNPVDRSITSLDEAPYKRLVRTPAYLKFRENKLNQIVESDFLYFYGINWHNRKAFIQGKLKNIDAIVDNFYEKDNMLLQLRNYLNEKFANTRKSLIE
jgi:hypothetical protein